MAIPPTSRCPITPVKENRMARHDPIGMVNVFHHPILFDQLGVGRAHAAGDIRGKRS